MGSYHELKEQSMARGEANDCAVIALAAVSGSPYAEVHSTLAAAGRKPRGATKWPAMRRTLQALGVEAVTRFGHPEYARLLAVPCGWWGFKPPKTVATLERFLQRHYPGHKFLIYTRGHVLAFDGDEVADWTKGRRHRVCAIVEVL